MRDQHFSKELKLKQKDIDDMDSKLHEQSELNEQKIENYRERLKRVEKTVYERVEQEYSKILTEKDHNISELNSRIMELESVFRQLKDELQAERVS